MIHFPANISLPECILVSLSRSKAFGIALDDILFARNGLFPVGSSFLRMVYFCPALSFCRPPWSKTLVFQRCFREDRGLVFGPAKGLGVKVGPNTDPHKVWLED